MALFLPKFERKKRRFMCWVLVCTWRSVKNCSSPSQLVVPSMLNSFCCSGNFLIRSLRYFAYSRFMKFSVAPESTNTIDLALFDFECMKKRTVINFLLDIYTSVVGLCLISANLIRLEENPVLLPSCQSESCSLEGIACRFEL